MEQWDEKESFGQSEKTGLRPQDEGRQSRLERETTEMMTEG